MISECLPSDAISVCWEAAGVRKEKRGEARKILDTGALSALLYRSAYKEKRPLLK